MYTYRIANDATIEDEKSDIYIIDSGERRRWWQQSRRTEGWSDSGDRVVAREKFRLGRRWFAVILDSRGLISRGREKVYSAGKMQLDGMTVAYWGADATRRAERGWRGEPRENLTCVRNARLHLSRRDAHQSKASFTPCSLSFPRSSSKRSSRRNIGAKGDKLYFLLLFLSFFFLFIRVQD